MSQTLNWILNHFHLIGWSGITALTGRLLWLTFKGGTLFVDAKGRILVAENHLNKMATNCMPTIQANTQATNEKLDKMTDILENINTGIAILVDRRQ